MGLFALPLDRIVRDLHCRLKQAYNMGGTLEKTSVAELEQRSIMLRRRIQQVAEDVTALLSEDLPLFVERELKRAFVNNPEFAKDMSDEKLQTLKDDIRTSGQSGKERILQQLSADSIWFPSAVPEESRHSIAQNSALWATVSGICDDVVELQEKYGFPPPETPIQYRPPTWFIGRRYLPTLSEKYWKLIGELLEVESKVADVIDEASKSELSQRWEKF